MRLTYLGRTCWSVKGATCPEVVRSLDDVSDLAMVMVHAERTMAMLMAGTEGEESEEVAKGAC